jgi:hypothetical protein
MTASTATALPSVPPISDQQRLAWEKESLGFFLSNHPFERAARHLASKVTVNSSQITEESKGERVTVAGCVMSVRKVITKRSETMCIAHIEDLHGSIEVVGFPRTYQQYADLWVEDSILVVQGKVDARDDRLQIIAEGLEAWDPGQNVESIPDDEVVTFQPTVVVAPTTHRAWRPAKSAEHGANGNANGNGNGHLNGNGHANGNGSRASAPEIVVRRLRVLVNRSDNEFADAKRLERLSHLLQDEGASPYEVIVAMPEGRFRVSAPECRVRLTADLERQLRDDFGEACVVVERT